MLNPSVFPVFEWFNLFDLDKLELTIHNWLTLGHEFSGLVVNQSAPRLEVTVQVCCVDSTPSGGKIDKNPKRECDPFEV